MNPVDAGKILLMAPAALAAVGILLVVLGSDALLPAGRLPGDFMVEKGRWRIYAPFGSALVLSVVFSLLLSLISRR